VMINMSSADLPAQPGNLAALGRLHDQCLGVIARVVTPGRVAVGDALVVL
jgi:MOSC domain-containing protein YiiM